jgi:hypothetical protein
MYLRSGLPPGGRPVLRILLYAVYAGSAKYAKYVIIVLYLACARPVGALMLR